jgi:hypothetical protein
MSMERIAWIDERLNDLANRMDAAFARVDADMRELRIEGIVIGLEGVIAAILVSPAGG